MVVVDWSLAVPTREPRAARTRNWRAAARLADLKSLSAIPPVAKSDDSRARARLLRSVPDPRQPPDPAAASTCTGPLPLERSRLVRVSGGTVDEGMRGPSPSLLVASRGTRRFAPSNPPGPCPLPNRHKLGAFAEGEISHRSFPSSPPLTGLEPTRDETLVARTGNRKRLVPQPRPLHFPSLAAAAIACCLCFVPEIEKRGGSHVAALFDWQYCCVAASCYN